MSTVVKDLGAVSAYAYAVEKGYTGTEAEFAELMASYATVGQTAVDAKDTAVAAKTAAETAAGTATNKASEAGQSASTASTKATEATTALSNAVTAKNDAVTAKTAAETAQGKAEDAQAAAEAVAESIPSDYSQLSEDVTELKKNLNDKASGYTILLNRSPNLFGRYTGNRNDVNSPVASTTRILSYPYIDADPKLRTIDITVTSGYKFVMYQIFAGGYVGGYTAYTWDTSDATITLDPRTTKLGLLIAKSDDSAITLDDYDKVAFKLRGDLSQIQEQIDSTQKEVFYKQSVKTDNTLGYYVKYADGTLVAADDYTTTDFIPVDEGQQYEFIGAITNVLGVVGYDSNKEYVQGLFKGASSSRAIASAIITIPEGVSYIRACTAWKNGSAFVSQKLVLNLLDEASLEYKVEQAENTTVAVGRITNIEGEDLLAETTWEQGMINGNSGANMTSSTRIRSPFVDVRGFRRISIKIADGYKWKVYWYNLNKEIYLPKLHYHDVFIDYDYDLEIIESVGYVRFAIATVEDASIIPSESGNVSVFYKNKVIDRLDTIGTPYYGIEDAFAAKKNRNSSDGANQNLNYLPNFLHISDLHGDVKRFERAVNMAQELKSDALICTGDFVEYYSTDDFSYVIRDVSGVPFTFCVGNHDVWNFPTEQEVYTKYIAPFASDMDLPSGVTYPTYFAKDLTDKSIRIISVNMYQSVNESGSSQTEHDKVHYHQEQITWFCNTLLSTPEGYGVIVLLHAPEYNPVADSTYNKFCMASGNFNAGVKPINEIIDAFISGEALAKTWNNPTGTPASFSCDIDFSAKNTGVEFIAYMSGHMHQDHISYVPETANKQLMLNIVCTCAWYNRTKGGYIGPDYPYYNEVNDLGRNDTGTTQDAVNAYVIDRVNKTVRVVRIGARRTYDLSVNRDFMVIPYADAT